MIDDDDALTHILSKLLKKFGYDVFCVNSFNAGLDMMQKQPFHAILLDMPMTGFEKISSLSILEKKNILTNQNLILFTGLDVSDFIIDGWKKKGLHSLIKKPVEFDAIIKELDTVTLNEKYGIFLEKIPTEEPLVEEPLVEEPLVEEPLVEEPLVEEPLVEEPLTMDVTKKTLDEIHSTFNSLKSKLDSIEIK